MQVSNETIEVLKNFAGINPNIVISPGQKLKTISEAKNIMAEADITEDFPLEFGIYDLNEFLSVLSLVDNPQLDFDESFVKVTNGGLNVKYFYSEKDILTTPQKDINMPECEVQFVLDNDTLNKLRSAATALGHTEVSVTPGDGVLTLSVVDNENATSNAYSIDVPYTSKPDTPFTFVINIGNLKIIPGDYEVSISSKLISEFKNKEVNVRYWIALEKTSTFGV